MNWWNVFHLFANVNILIISSIAKEEAIGNSEIEISEESSSEEEQSQYEEAETSSINALHQNQSETYQLEYLNNFTENLHTSKYGQNFY